MPDALLAEVSKNKASISLAKDLPSSSVTTSSCSYKSDLLAATQITIFLGAWSLICWYQ